MIRWLLRKLGYRKVEMGLIAGWYCVTIDGVSLALNPDNGVSIKEEKVRELIQRLRKVGD